MHRGLSGGKKNAPVAERKADLVLESLSLRSDMLGSLGAVFW
jgi:hypothetical protein